jgi:hypothetical protein
LKCIWGAEHNFGPGIYSGQDNGKHGRNEWKKKKYKTGKEESLFEMPLSSHHLYLSAVTNK